MIKGQRSKLKLLDDYTGYNEKELNEIYQNLSFSFVELANRYITGEMTMDEICKIVENHIEEEVYKIIRKEEVEP